MDAVLMLILAYWMPRVAFLVTRMCSVLNALITLKLRSIFMSVTRIMTTFHSSLGDVVSKLINEISKAGLYSKSMLPNCEERLFGIME